MLTEHSSPELRIPSGSPWKSVKKTQSKTTEDIPEGHIEADDFDGDHVLANSILFIREFGWWIEMNYAVTEGDIGRAWEIMKVGRFIDIDFFNAGIITDLDLCIRRV